MLPTKKYRYFSAIVSVIALTSFIPNPITTQALTKQQMAPQQILTKQDKPLNPEEGIEFLKESGHHYDIETLVFSRDGQTLVSSSLYNKIHVWNIKNKKLIRTINPGKNGSTTLALSSDGQTLYTGTYLESGIIQVWNIKTGKLIRRINSHKSGISNLVLIPNGKTLIAAGQDKTIKLWNTQTGKLISTVKGHNAPVTAIAVSPNQNIFATSGGVQGDSKDLTIRLWDIKTGKLFKTLTNNVQTAGFLAFSPDGKSLISARGKSSDYGRTNIWNLSTGKITVTIPKSVIFIGFTSDGKRLLSVDGLYAVDLWDAATGANIRQIVEPIKFEDDRTYSRVYPSTAVMSPDNKTLVIGEGGVLSGYRIGIRQLNLQQIKSAPRVDTNAPKSNKFRYEGILRENMAQLLGIEEQQVKLVKVETATWQKCLPTPGRAGTCKPVTLSGHRVVMSGKGETWIYYVSSDGLISLDKRIPNVSTQTLVGRWEGKQSGSQTSSGTAIFLSCNINC
jgi:DNA-binding beta-propeller fold protein YncE